MVLISRLSNSINKASTRITMWFSLATHGTKDIRREAVERGIDLAAIAGRMIIEKSLM
jgi:hypothetical protein